jgi:two-component system sensor histidine kinase FlrB
MPPGLSDPSLSGFALPTIGAPPSFGAHAIEDEQHLLRAFRTFAETAGSLERSYSLLRAEVARLRAELEESHAGLARSLEENRAMRRHLNRILESLPCGVAVVSASGEITHLNPEGMRLLGFEQKIPCLEAPESIANLRGELRELLNSAREEAGERELEVFIVPGRKRWLAARHAALAEMSAVLAHEVRNPLGSLELFASLLSEADLGAECQEWIGHVQHGLRTLAATVNNVLHFHGAPPPERTPVDLGQMLDWATGFLAPLARRTGVQLVLRNALGGVVFAADRHQLGQVLLNLSLNSLRVMPDGGRLSLEGLTELETPESSSMAIITVSDPGRELRRRTWTKSSRRGSAHATAVRDWAWPCAAKSSSSRVTALAAGPDIGAASLEGYEWNIDQPALCASTENQLRPGLKVGEMERQLFALTLAATGGNRSRAAELLGVSLRTVRNKIRSYGLPRWEGGSIHDGKAGSPGS